LFRIRAAGRVQRDSRRKLDIIYETAARFVRRNRQQILMGGPGSPL
jgi:hypothetical protein